jgi:ankyrin repeat protein
MNTKAKALNAYAGNYGPTGSTPLHVAGNCPIVKSLLKAGANLKIKDENGQTPADAALQRRDYRSCCLIMSAGGRLTKESKRTW